VIRHYVPFGVYYFRHYFRLTFFTIQHYVPFGVYYFLHYFRSTFFDQRHFVSIVCPFVIIYHSTVCPYDIFNYSTFFPLTFCPIQCFVPWRFFYRRRILIWCFLGEYYCTQGIIRKLFWGKKLVHVYGTTYTGRASRQTREIKKIPKIPLYIYVPTYSKTSTRYLS
jgi:hypothetical protein